MAIDLSNEIIASDITSGTISPEILGSGTADSTTYLRGDNTWATISAGGLTNFTEARITTAPNTATNVDSLSAGNGLSTTDIDIALLPKANGAFLLNIPDSSITGGNKRGTNAIDLQISRTANTQVASGNYAVAIGYSNTASNTSATAIGRLNSASALGSTALGYQNTSSGSYSFSVGFSNTSSGNYSTSSGLSNIASGLYSVCLGNNNTANQEGAISIGYQSFSTAICAVSLGQASTASGQDSVAIGRQNSASAISATAIGRSNTASGDYSVSIGYACTSSGDYSISLGTYANTFSQTGRIAFSSGRISAGGDIQKSFYILKGRSSSATPKTLTSDNGSITTASVIVLQNNNVFRFKGSIVGKQTGTTNIGVWDIDGVIVRGANAAATTLTISNINLVTNASSWGTPTLTADTTNGGLTINVVGLAATNIQWIADVQTSEVIY
jgi:hypothetical protein